uniref:Uncharacterized protein n=1 Tax=Zea mays TaxID=4577 RepID=A0A804QVS5_MAIZE
MTKHRVLQPSKLRRQGGWGKGVERVPHMVKMKKDGGSTLCHTLTSATMPSLPERRKALSTVKDSRLDRCLRAVGSEHDREQHEAATTDGRETGWRLTPWRGA